MIASGKGQDWGDLREERREAQGEKELDSRGRKPFHMCRLHNGGTDSRLRDRACSGTGYTSKQRPQDSSVRQTVLDCSSVWKGLGSSNGT